MPPRYAFRLEDPRVFHLVRASCHACGHKEVIPNASLLQERPGYTRLTGVGTLDTLHMRMGDWETLKRLLLAHPRFHLGKAFFEPEVWEGFAGEGDFLNAGVWNGDYRELIRLLAAFEYRANRPARNEASAEARAIIQPDARISRFGWPDGPPRTRPAFASSRAAETRMSLGS